MLQAGDDAFDGRIEIRGRDVARIPPAGEDRRLVRDVRQVGAGETGRLSRDHLELHVGSERLRSRVHMQDRFASCAVRRCDEELPIETARPQKGRIEVLQPVRGPHDDHLIGRSEPIQLDEKLVQGLILLTVETVTGSRGTDRVELIDEDDRGRVLTRLCEQLANTSGAETGEHLDKAGRALRVELRT